MREHILQIQIRVQKKEGETTKSNMNKHHLENEKTEEAPKNGAGHLCLSSEVSEATYGKLWGSGMTPEIKKTNVRPRSYNGTCIPLLGAIEKKHFWEAIYG